MATQRKTLYLYLALACFLGIILIFVFDGYMGVYDGLEFDNGQYQQKFEVYQWEDQERYGYIGSATTEYGGTIDFVYTVENHRFSAYQADVAVTLWYGQDKIADVVSEPITAGAFNSGELTWTLDTVALVPPDYPDEDRYSITMIIERDGTERRINVNINPSSYPKPIAVPVPE